MPLDGSEFFVSGVTQELVVARQRIKDGWCHKGGRNRNGVCMIFALGGDNEVRKSCMRFLSIAIGDLPLVAWNDHDDRVKDDVLEAYDKAIELSLTV